MTNEQRYLDRQSLMLKHIAAMEPAPMITVPEDLDFKDIGFRALPPLIVTDSTGA